MALTKVSSKTLSDNAVTSDKIAAGAISVSDMADNSITAAKLHTSVQGALGTRNLIINGDMRIAQRGTSTTYQYANGYYTADRWKMSVDNNWYSEFNIDVVTDVPDGQGFAKALKYSIGYNGGNGGGANLKIQQRIEGQNIQHLKKGTSNAESLTLSFWVKSNKTGTYIAELYDVDNTRSISKSYTINTADTWEKKTITYAGDTTGTFGNDNNASLDINLFLIAASAYTSGTLQTSWGTVTDANRAVGQVDFLDNNSNYYTVTGVQLEVGDTATPFEHRPYDMELSRCQRYYFSTLDQGTEIYGYVCQAISSSRLGHTAQFPVTMRDMPTITIYSPFNEIAGKVALYNATSTDIGSGFTSVVPRPQGNYYVANGSGLTTGNWYSYKITADGEL